MIADRPTRIALDRLHRLGLRASERAWAQTTAPATEKLAAGQARQRVLDNLPAFLDQLETQAQAHGVRVHRAADFQEANRAIVAILRQATCTDVLCNLAPLLDEIALDRAAAANGLNLTRLHPGAHLAALAGSRAAHPIWPAAHLNLEDLSAAAQTHWRIPPTYDPANLAATTRNHLHPILLDARAAILGLHFAVAATGALICLDNDGHNASLVALADHLICLIGIEQIVADTADLHLLISALARSAWGQPLPTYITPVVPTSDKPRHIHLILVDNGRSRILDAGLGEALRCISCGACHNVCPVYQQIGGPGYANLAHTGPIGAVLNPFLRPTHAGAQPYLSTACDACRPLCPVGIDIPHLLHRQRQRLAPAAPWQERAAFWLWQRLLTRPRLFTLTLRLAHRLRQP